MGGDFVPPGVSFPEAPLFSKVAREGLVLLAVDTELCRFVLPRILDIVRERGAIAFTIQVQRDERIQRVEIEVAGLSERGRSAMLDALRRLGNVRQARFGFPPNATGLPIAAKL